MKRSDASSDAAKAEAVPYPNLSLCRHVSTSPVRRRAYNPNSRPDRLILVLAAQKKLSLSLNWNNTMMETTADITMRYNNRASHCLLLLRTTPSRPRAIEPRATMARKYGGQAEVPVTSF